MLSSRCLQVTVLVLTFGVLAGGFMFVGDFVQEAQAVDCDTEYAVCKAWRGIATYICNTHGWSSDECAIAVGNALTKCWPWITNCSGG